MKKGTKFLVGGMLTMVVALGMNTTMASAKAAGWLDDYSYEVYEDGTVSLSQYKGNEVDITVPGQVTLEGKKYNVTINSAASFVWGNDKKLKSLTFEEGFKVPESCLNIFSDLDQVEKIDVSKWDTSKVTDMSRMFANCTSLKELNVTNWNTSQVKNMGSMFWKCTSLYKVDANAWNVANVEDLSFMFYNCEQLTALDMHSWDTSKVKNINYMFAGCKHLKTVNTKGWNTKNVEQIDGLFESASSLTSVDMSSFDLSKCAISKNDHIFLRCGSLKTIKTPKKLKKSIELDGTLTYKCKGKKYTKVPKGNKSIKLVCVTKAAQAPKISSVKSKKGKVTVTWKKIKLTKIEKLSDQEIHYELQCSTNKRFTDNVGKFSNYSDMDSRKHVPNTIDGIIWKNTSTISGLQKGKTYYIRVRTDRNYALISKWSKVKTIKVK